MLLKPPLPPMESRLVDEIPTGEGWQYEPKWDGFRCIAFRDGDQVTFNQRTASRSRAIFPMSSVLSLRCQRNNSLSMANLLFQSTARFHLMNCNSVCIRPPVASRSWPKRIRRSTSFSICSQRTETPI
jgi:hypothetical protein